MAYFWGWGGEYTDQWPIDSGIPVFAEISPPEMPTELPSGTFISVASSNGDGKLWLRDDGDIFGTGDLPSWVDLPGTGPYGRTPTLITTIAGAAKLCIASDAAQAAVLTADGDLWTWGRNNYGQCGVARVASVTDVEVDTPTLIPRKDSSSPWTFAEASSLILIAVNEAGKLYICGYNQGDRLFPWNTALPDIVDTLQEVPHPNSKEWVFARGHGQGSLVAMDEDGRLWAWGYDGNQLLGTFLGPYAPMTQVLAATDPYDDETLEVDTIWLDVRQAAYHTMGLKSDGNIYTWGLAPPYCHTQPGYVDDWYDLWYPVPLTTGGGYTAIYPLNEAVLGRAGTTWVCQGANWQLGFYPGDADEYWEYTTAWATFPVQGILELEGNGYSDYLYVAFSTENTLTSGDPPDPPPEPGDGYIATYVQC